LLKNEVENIKKGFFNSPLGSCKNSFVSACDQGEIAALCLLEGPDKHVNKYYDITGPQAQSMHEVAATLSEVMGQKVEYREQDIEQFAKDFGPTRAQFFEYLRNGFYTRCSPDFYNLTGRKPTSYKEYLTQPGPHGGTGLEELFSATGSIYTKGVDQFKDLGNVQKRGFSSSARQMSTSPTQDPHFTYSAAEHKGLFLPEGYTYASVATHGGLPPKQEEHFMNGVLKKHGANFFPHIPDYHWLPYYGGSSAPKWEMPKDVPNVGWADHVMGEVDNALVNCGMDLPVFGLVDVKGPKAFEFLDRASTKKAPRKAGIIRLAYTLTKDGTLWNDISLNTRGENDVYFVGLAGFGKYEMDQLEGLRNEFGYTSDDVSLTNVSYDRQLYHIFGPKAPKILSEVLGQEVVDVPHFKFQSVTVKGIPIEVYHMSYAALPGWELHTTKEYAPALYDLLLEHPTSKAEGFKPCGVMGIQSLRTEMFFRGTPDVKNICHYSEGLIEKAIGKDHDFYGKNTSFEKQKQMIMLTVETPKGQEWSLFGAQYPIYQNGVQVGNTLHSAFGGRSRKTHAWAIVDAKIAGNGKPFAVHAHNTEMPSVQISEPLVPSTFR
jgi:glycine cleavage system aminomethyltransferase T